MKYAKIILKNGAHDVTGEQKSEEWFVNRMPYEKIIISGKGYISIEALFSTKSEQSQFGINRYFWKTN